jgi:hypothetical protein
MLEVSHRARRGWLIRPVRQFSRLVSTWDAHARKSFFRLISPLPQNAFRESRDQSSRNSHRNRQPARYSRDRLEGCSIPLLKLVPIRASAFVHRARVFLSELCSAEESDVSSCWLQNLVRPLPDTVSTDPKMSIRKAGEKILFMGPGRVPA